MSENDWWRDEQQLRAMVQRHGTVTNAARAEGRPSVSTATRAWNALKAGEPLPRSTGDAARARYSKSPQDASSASEQTSIEVDPSQVRWTDSDLLEFHGLDPDLNIITRRQAKRWNAALGDGQVAEMNGLTITAEARYPAGAILPARADGWRPPRPKKSRRKVAARVITVSTDWHLPYQDEGLFDCYLQVLEELQPDEDWDLGDLVDFPQPSRHRMTRGFEATPQECIDARYQHDAQRVAAAPNARHVRMYGNHCVRLDIAITEKISQHVARLARAGDEIPVMDLGHLLRYDELGIEVLRPEGDYHSVVAKIVDGLNARHGTKSGPYGGATKTMSRRNSSQLSGHDHHQVLMQHVSYDDEDSPVITISASIGCGASRAVARSYTEDADINMGFAVVTDHGGGSFNVELARYDDARRELFFRGARYLPR